MDLNFILKLCWTIIVVILTLIAIFAFVETIINKIREPKKKKELNAVIDKFTDEFVKYMEEELNKEDKPKPKRKTTKKVVKKEE